MTVRPAAGIAALPAVTPFVAPEELARRVGRSSLVRLGANESAFGPPPAALAAMHAELARISYYGDPASLELRTAIAARHACGVENVTVGSGIDDLLGLVVRAYLAPGDTTVAAHGTYPTYAYHVVGYGARLDGVPYRADGTVPLEALAARAHETNARIAYLANPDNPSGTFADRAAVAAFRAALPDDCLLVLDEAYGDFVPASERLVTAFDGSIVWLRTFSKAYGLAGARIAYALGAPDLARTLAKIRLHFGINRPAQAAALAALGEDAFVRDVVAEVERGRAEYDELARTLGLKTLRSRTNFVCFDLGTRARAEAMVEALLERGIFVRKPGMPPLEGHVRVTVGTQAERARFAAAFTDALDAREASVAAS